MGWVTRTKIKSEFWSGAWWSSPATPDYGRMLFTDNKFEENLCYIARSQREKKNENRSKFFLYCWLLNSKNLFASIPEYGIRKNKYKELLQFVCFPTSIPSCSKLVLSGSFHRKLCENHSPCVKLCLTQVAITDIFDTLCWKSYSQLIPRVWTWPNLQVSLRRKLPGSTYCYLILHKVFTSLTWSVLL